MPGKRVRKPPQALLHYEDIPVSVAKHFESLKTDSGHSAQTHNASNKERSPAACFHENELVSPAHLSQGAGGGACEHATTATTEICVVHVDISVTLPAPGAWRFREGGAVDAAEPDTAKARPIQRCQPPCASGVAPSGFCTGLQLTTAIRVIGAQPAVTAMPIGKAFTQLTKHAQPPIAPGKRAVSSVADESFIYSVDDTSGTWDRSSAPASRLASASAPGTPTTKTRGRAIDGSGFGVSAEVNGLACSRNAAKVGVAKISKRARQRAPPIAPPFAPSASLRASAQRQKKCPRRAE